MTYNRLILIRPPSLQCITVFFSEKAGVVLNKSWNCFYLRSEAESISVYGPLMSVHLDTTCCTMPMHLPCPTHSQHTDAIRSSTIDFLWSCIISFFLPYFSVIIDKIRDFFTLPFPVWQCPGQFTFIVVPYIREFIFTIYSCISDTYNIFSFNY